MRVIVWGALFSAGEIMGRDDQAIQEAVRQAITDAHNRQDQHKPDWSDNWLIFGLCRHFLNVYGAEQIDATLLEPYVMSFWSACRDIGTPEDWEDCWLQFLDIWDHQKALMPTGKNIVPIAVFRARQAKDRPQWANIGTPRLRFLTRICWELATMHPDGRFFLKQQEAAEILGTDQRTVGRMFHQLCREGIIIEVERPPKGTLKSPRFRFTNTLPILPKRL